MGGKITGKGKIKTGKLDFDDVYFIKELKFNLFSVSQMCDKKNSVLFTDTECLVLSYDFRLPDASHVLLRVPKENNMYNVNLRNIVPFGDLTCLFAKVTLDESNLWHRRLGHVNFKTINKLVKDNLVRGLPIKVFTYENSCVACKKGKQHRASCKSKTVSSVDQPLFRLHIDLFGLTFVKSLSKKSYCLVITNDYNRFSWVFFLASKDETTPVLKTFIIGLENLLSLKVKVIRCNNGTEFKNSDLNQFYGLKGIKREFSVPRTPQQKGIAERKNRTLIEFEECTNNGSNGVNAASSSVPIAGHNFINSTNDFSAAGPLNVAASPTVANSSSQDASTSTHDLNMPNLENLTHFDDADNVGAEADINNLESIISVSLIPTTRIHKDHPTSQIIGDLSSTTQTRSMARTVRDQGGISQMFNEDFHTFMFACFLSQEEPKRIHQALKDPNLPYGKRAIGTKWVYRNKKDERGIVIKNKAKFVAQGHTQEEGIDYEEVFALVARIEAIRLFLAYASFMGFLVYQMDVKSAFLYGTIKEEVYACQPPGFEDLENPDKVYKVVKALYGLHQAPRAWYETLATYLLENGFQRGTIDQTFFIKKQQKDILLVQIYVDDIIFCAINEALCQSFEKLMKDKFQMSSMGELTFFLASTPIDAEKPLLKDSDGEDVDVHTYRSMTGSLMYLTS
uniref:Putative ribonuclease H-like domain-containing protein n=1 Tax=Tanacetum cinerariifolium TaxID=118510 RepID=A0A699JSS9_TANCI|nr:putative ribonuclease H-like domain-containing protein [Tanacetum cinerariifolium]